jgi:hypothetical protein
MKITLEINIENEHLDNAIGEELYQDELHEAMVITNTFVDDLGEPIALTKQIIAHKIIKELESLELGYPEFDVKTTCIL